MSKFPAIFVSGMGGCTSAPNSLKLPSEKRFRRAIKLYEVSEVSSLANLFNRNRCFETGESPLTLAAEEGHEAIVQALVRSGADVDKLDRNGRGPLHIAATFNDEETIDILLAAKANPNRYDSCNNTPLHIACEKGFKNIVQKLLAGGADPNECRRTLPPLIYAVIHSNGECVDALLYYGADPNVFDARGNTALHTAIANSDVISTASLLKHRADPFAKSRDNDTLVCLAALSACPGTLEALIKARCDVLTHHAEEPSPLIAAVALGSIECVDLLLAAGVNPDETDRRGHSSLHTAVMSIIDMDREIFYSKYFSNVYRNYSKYDPGELNAENRCKCAMSLVQSGADVTKVWEKFVQIFPDPRGVSFEQMVLCEVLVQAYGFDEMPPQQIRAFVNNLLHMREYGLIKLLYSSGIDPVLEDLTVVALRNEDLDKEVFVWMKKLMSNPRQLRDLCRRKVRKMVSWNILYSIENMDLPEEIKSYVCIMDTEHYSAAEPLTTVESLSTVEPCTSDCIV